MTAEEVKMERNSDEKCSEGTVSNGSVSSHSERDSEDHGLLPNGDSENNAEPNHHHLDHISSDINENEVVNEKEEVKETVKSLTEKLSAALLSINSKEELVKQHSKVAEEAVSGWEKAENEVLVLKQQLDAVTQKNSILEDRINHLDGALKECVRQLRQSKDEHERKLNDAVAKSTQNLVSINTDLEIQVAELKAKLEASQLIKKENTALKEKLLFQSEELKLLKEESDFSIQAAEAASKQHLDSVKKAAKLDAECNRLKSLVRKSSTPCNDHKIASSSICVDSTTDSQSDNCSDSWASALIAELDQFKNEKVVPKMIVSSLDSGLMDDFLEMERLVAMPETEADNVSSSQAEDKVIMKQKIVELEEKVEASKNENANLEIALSESQYQLNIVKELKESAVAEVVKLKDKVCLMERRFAEESALFSSMKNELLKSECKKEAIESQLHSAHLEIDKLNEKILVLEDTEIRNLQDRVQTLEQQIEDERAACNELDDKLEATERERMALEVELELKRSEIRKLSDEIVNLQEKLHTETALSSQFALRFQKLEDESTKKREVEMQMVSKTNGELTAIQEKELAVAAEKLAECQKTISSLSQQLKSLTTLDDIILESENIGVKGSAKAKTGASAEPTITNGKERGSPLSGLGKFLSRSRSHIDT